MFNIYFHKQTITNCNLQWSRLSTALHTKHLTTTKWFSRHYLRKKMLLNGSEWPKISQIAVICNDLLIFHRFPCFVLLLFSVDSRYLSAFPCHNAVTHCETVRHPSCTLGDGSDASSAINLIVAVSPVSNLHVTSRVWRFSSSLDPYP